MTIRPLPWDTAHRTALEYSRRHAGVKCYVHRANPNEPGLYVVGVDPVHRNMPCVQAYQSGKVVRSGYNLRARP